MKNTNTKNFDITTKRKLFIAAPLVLLVCLIVFTLIFDAVVSIEFTGGTMMTYSHTGDIELSRVETEIRELNLPTAVVTSGSAFGTDVELINISFSSNRELSAEQLSALTERLTEIFPNNNIILENNQNVSPGTGLRFFLKCLAALAFSFLLFILYIAIRFRKLGGWSTGVFALIALFVDMTVVVSVFVFFRLPIDSIFVAVILAIMGYSINGTIIIFDRIRENKTLFSGKRTNRELFNLSLKQSLSRTVNTTLTTMSALLVLSIVAVVYNVNTVLNFAFPMLVGLISGAFTSLCFAGTFWVMWQERKSKKLKTKT